MDNIPISKIVNKFHLEVISGEDNLSKVVESADIHRPGLEFTGYLDYFPKERIQLLGKTEIMYLHSLPIATQDARIQDVIAKRPPCFVITRAQQDISLFARYCTRYGVPLLRTEAKSTPFISALHSYLEKQLAEEVMVHGVCMNIFGVGVLLRGASGIGKSEVALALVERSHRLISDDLVAIKKIGSDTLLGTHNGNNKELLHLRGIGFIDVTRLFGSGAFQDETKLDLEIDLIHWNDQTSPEVISLGSEESEANYLDMKLPLIQIPVRPGRDIASLIEVACKNWRLKREGFDALKVFEERVWGA